MRARTTVKSRVALCAVISLLALLSSTAAAEPRGRARASCGNRVNNTISKLLQCVTIEGLRAHQAAFQAIADAHGGVRAAGTPGYDQSVAYVAETLAQAGYEVVVQPFPYNSWTQLGPSTLEQAAPVAAVYTEDLDYLLMGHTDAGDVTAAVTAVDVDLGPGNASTSGCEAADFAGFPVGHIALLQRGACAFGLKAENAAAAGAVGAIIFNQGNTPGRFGVVAAALSADFGGGIPVMFATYYLGEEWASTAGLVLHMAADVERSETTSYNVLAETADGDRNNAVMAGAHLDSTNRGPGIQDNGSGSAAILETALGMARVKPRNKVRFAWWGAEEAGLIGSTYYVDNLSEEEREQITLYLNFDMIGSPNHVFFIYDGDDSDGVGAGPGPAGSEQIEQLFELYYTTRGEAFKGTDFSGRSDYGPFIAVGIPSGGIFTGAEDIKTAEEAAAWGGTAGEQYDPCYHLACDTFDNINLEALDINADAVAFAVLQYAMNTISLNGRKGKGNFKPNDGEYWGPSALR